MVLTILLTAVVTGLVGYLALTLVLARRAPAPTNGEAPKLLWVFVVPARDEARSLRRTLDSLLAVDDDHTRVLVVDDASDDDTAAVAASYPRDKVWLLRRRRPLARKGKGAALNHAYQVIRRRAADAGVPAERVVLGIVDGDGRLPVDVTRAVGHHLADPTVGAVQVQVRIADRRFGWLPRLQDVEMVTLPALTQRSRQALGSVGLGGNGQFTRLAALESLGSHPWTDCLTEDLELGLRLGMAGWHTRFTDTTEIAEHGLTHLGALTRQRTRWMQGHLQCAEHIPALVRSPLPTATVLDLLAHLATPVLVLLASVVLGLPALLAVLGVVALAATGSIGADAWPWVVLAYLLAFGPALAASLLYRRKVDDLSVPRTLATAHLLAGYAYLWYAATWRAVGRSLTGRHAWTETSPGHRPAQQAPDDPELDALIDSLVAAPPPPTPGSTVAGLR